MTEYYKELESMISEILSLAESLPRLKAVVESAVEKALEKDVTLPKLPKSEEEIVDYVLHTSNLIALVFLKDAIKAEEKQNE